MIPRLLLLTLILTMLPTPAKTIDTSYNLTQVIMQTDMETLLVHTDLTNSRQALIDIKGELLQAKLGVTVNNIGHYDDSTRRQMILGDILQSLANEVDDSLVRLDDLFEKHQTHTSRQSRAFEFLGDMLSGITGVPSARDHRQLLEKIKLLKLDNEGIKTLMLSRNAQQQDVIETLSQHDSSIAKLSDRLLSTENLILNHKRDDLQLAGILALQEKAYLALSHSNRIYFKINNILMLGDDDRLSRFGITKEELGRILDSISLRRKEGVPIYGRDEIEQYYKQRLSHSWTIPYLHEVITLIQIPIASLHSRLELTVLDHDNIMSSDLTMAVVDKQANKFRYLSLSDFHRCTELRGRLICQKRSISILPPMGCSLQIKNCKLWATTVVHDITNTNFIFLSNNSTNITSTCGKNKPRTYRLPKNSMMKVPLSCTVTSNQFTIDRSSYAEIINIDGKSDNVKIELEIDPAILATTPLKKLAKEMDLTKVNLTRLRMKNDKFEIDLALQRLRTDTNWENIRSGTVNWFDFITWALLAICLTICALLGLCQLKTYCNTKEREEIRQKEREEYETASADIIERIRTVETATALVIHTNNSKQTPQSTNQA